MGIDTTPRSGEPEPDRPENAPQWVLVLIVVLVVLGGLWILMSIMKSGY